MKPIFFFLLYLIFPLFGEGALSVPTLLTHERKALPGERYRGKIPIVNQGDQAISATVKLVDYHYNSRGESYFEPAGTRSRSNAPWITLKEKTIEVPPGCTLQIGYDVAIPQENQLSGTYWSVLLIEPDAISAIEGKDISLQTKLRYGIQLITQIGEIGSQELKLLNKTIEEEDERTTGFFEVENKGSRLMEPILLLDLYDSTGKLIHHFLGQKLRILPSCSVKYDIDLSSLSPGTYQALITLDSGEKGIFEFKEELTL
jgi:hypothetical protein